MKGTFGGSESSRFGFFLITWAFLVTIAGASNSNTGVKGSYSYAGGKSRDLSLGNSSPVASPVLTPSSPPTMAGSPSSFTHTSYYEPRGDYSGGGGGGYGGGGGGAGNGGWGGGGPSVYHYMHQPYYHPAPAYYDDGGFEGVEKGLIGLLGLTGLKGLLGLLGLAKLLLPLLALLIPLLLPLLLLKAAALLFLLLLIPVPVISTGRKLLSSFEEGKGFLKETISDVMNKIPSDLNQIINKIKEPTSLSAPTADQPTSKIFKMKEVNRALKERTLSEPKKKIITSVPVTENNGSNKSKS